MHATLLRLLLPLSRRSHPAAVAFTTALFLHGKPPAWMREIKDSKEVEA